MTIIDRITLTFIPQDTNIQCRHGCGPAKWYVIAGNANEGNPFCADCARDITADLVKETPKVCTHLVDTTTGRPVGLDELTA